MVKRQKFEDNPKFLVVARSIVVDDNNNILLLKRSKNHYYYPKKWELPGGKLLVDRDPWASLTEIVNRETSIIIDPKSNRFYSHSRLVSEEGKYKGFVYVELACESNYVGGRVRLTKSEHTDYEWAEREDVFSFDLTLESKKALAQYFVDVKTEMEGGRYAVKLVNRAIVRNKQGKILLLKRAAKESYPGAWELPGGKFTTLETLSVILKREVFEETGLVIDISNSVAHFSSSIGTEGKYKGRTFVNIISEAVVTAGKLELSVEHSDCGWFTEAEMFKLGLAPNVKLPLTELFLKAK